MAGITQAMAQDQLELYMAAEATVLKNQSYEIKGRKLTRANLAEIQQGVEYWDAKVKTLANRSRGRSRTMVAGG